ncbi:hypothetical protein BH11BAC1_BH11BAC1_14530 [soil metagenome]
MKSNPFNTLAALLIFFSFSVKGQSSKGDSTIIIKTNIYCDHCLDCNDCGGKLVHDLSFAKGIKRNVVDPKAMTITITYNSAKTSPEIIRGEISKLGYDADEVKANPLAYEKLDGCCKK